MAWLLDDCAFMSVEPVCLVKEPIRRLLQMLGQ
jgi:hypothetical protein